MKRFLSIILGLVCCEMISACGSSSDDNNDGSPASSSVWTNTAMQSVVGSNCATAGCHNGTRSPNYKTISEAGMKADSSALSRVNAKTMPPQGLTLSSADLATFQDFYK